MKVFNGKLLYVDGDKLIFSKNGVVYQGFPNTTNHQKIAHFKGSFLDELAHYIPLANRIGRLGIHTLEKLPNGDWIGIAKKHIIYKQKGATEFKGIFNIPRGSRPLNLCINPQNEHVFFGEYFSNPKRDAVNIFGSPNGKDWTNIYTFPAATIRHIHGIYYDNFRKGIWVLTGDSDKESGLWFTQDNFKTLKPIITGTQKARAVAIIPTEKGLIVPMDSPHTKNYIQYFDLEKTAFTPLQLLPGSAFHAAYSSHHQLYFVTTVVEPSKVNHANYVAIFASLDGEHWTSLAAFQQDFYSNLSYKFFRYPEIEICAGNNETDSIYFYCRGIKKYSEKTIAFKVENIKSLLSRSSV